MRSIRRAIFLSSIFVALIFVMNFFARTTFGEDNVSPTPTPESSGSGSGGSGSDGSSSMSPTFTPTPTPFSSSSGSGSSNSSPTPTLSFSTEMLDRFAQVDENTLSCIKTRLNDTEFERLRHLIPQTESEYKELENLKEKASICFESYEEVRQIEEASREVQEISGKIQECLVSTIGQTAFDEINSGLRKPTNEERGSGEACFNDDERSKIVYQTVEQELGDDVNSCLALALGERRFREIKSLNSNLNLLERGKVGRCFGVSPHPLSNLPEYKMPDEVTDCLNVKLGKEAFEEIRSGERIPTDSEELIGKSCFAKLNKTQIKFLPNPPDQVPFLTEKPDLVEVLAASEEEEVVSENVINRKIILRGNGQPRSLIDIYIFSDPIVVTTESDENGDWIYEMNYPLEAGEHIAYATLRTKDGTSVRSSVFGFQVLAAGSTNQEFLKESRASAVPSKFLNYAIALIALSLLTALVGVFYVFRSIKKTEKIGQSANVNSTSSSKEE